MGRSSKRRTLSLAGDPQVEMLAEAIKFTLGSLAAHFFYADQFIDLLFQNAALLVPDGMISGS